MRSIFWIVSILAAVSLTGTIAPRFELPWQQVSFVFAMLFTLVAIAAKFELTPALRYQPSTKK